MPLDPWSLLEHVMNLLRFLAVVALLRAVWGMRRDLQRQIGHRDAGRRPGDA